MPVIIGGNASAARQRQIEAETMLREADSTQLASVSISISIRRPLSKVKRWRERRGISRLSGEALIHLYEMAHQRGDRESGSKSPAYPFKCRACLAGAIELNFAA